MVGESVKTHIRRLRFEHAVHRLKFGTQPITYIAFEAGYETHEAFTRAFRAMFAQSPSRFRVIHRVLPVSPAPSGVHYLPDGRLNDFERVETGGPPVDVHVTRIEPMRVAFVRHVGPYAEVGATWDKLMAWAGAKGLLGPKMTTLGLLHDDPDVTPPDKVRYDACLVIDDSVEPEGELGVQTIRGGEYAVTTHRGPYEQLSDAYARLCGEWLPTGGRELRSAPGFEIYRNSPQTAVPEDLLTDIHLPLQE
jgi:AraC family transcriptional regulator